jgi:hypothetical protein
MTDKLILNTNELTFGNTSLHTFVTNSDGSVTLVQDDDQPIEFTVNGNMTVSNDLEVQGNYTITEINAQTINAANITSTETSRFERVTIGSPGLFDATESTLTLGNHMTINANSTTTTIDGTLQAQTMIVDGLNVKERILNASTSTVRYYVKTNGSDAEDGKSWDRAFATIRHAAQVAPSGSTIYLETGTYTEITPIRLKPRTAIIGDNLRLCIIKAVDPRLDYFHVDNLCYLLGLRFVDLQRPAFCCAFPCAIAEPTIQFGSVANITILYSPTGYTSPPPVIVQAPENLFGIQATATAVLTHGVITSFIITNPGSGYGTLRPHISIPAVSRPFITGSPYIQNCSSITGPFNKQVPSTKISEFTQLPYNISDVDQEGAGGGCRIDGAVCFRGVVGNVTIINGGSGYTSPPNVVFSDGAATGFATLSGTSVSSVSITNGGSYVNIPTMTFVGGGGSGATGTVVMSVPPSPLRSFVADSFTQVNQGGPGHLIINLGYAQFVSCFTTFCTYSFKAVAGGFTNISTSVTDFGIYGLVSSGYWPIPIASGKISQRYRSSVTGVTISDSGTGPGGSGYTSPPDVLFSSAGYDVLISNALDGVDGDALGTSVSVSANGTRYIAGASNKTYLNLTHAGALYVYSSTGTQEAKILAPTPSANAQFGFRSALSGDSTRLVVSSFGDQKTFVYSRSGSTWTYETELVPGDKSPGDSFGSSVAITFDGTRIVVGSPNHDPSGVVNAGAAYVFTRSGTTWTQETKVTANDAIVNANFGESVSINATTGDTLVIGAPRDNPTGNPGTLDSGSAYVFTRVSTVWTQQTKVSAGDAAPSDAFGSSVSLSADSTRCAIGAPLKNSVSVVDTGGVYVFSGSGASWTQETLLVPINVAASDMFGYGVAMNADGSRLVFGSSAQGLGYLFVRVGTTWVEYDMFTASGLASVAITDSGTRVLIGAKNNSNVRGAVYVYDMSSPAQGTSVLFVDRVNSVIITNPGSYEETPTVTFIGGGGTGAEGTVKLQAPQIILVTNATGRKPDVGSVTLYKSTWYTVTGAAVTGAGTYNVTFYPPIYSTDADDIVYFYIASQVSTGGHVTEYVGSGVTYNALPEYGGVPNAGNKYLEITPGKVYFNISDHLGNQDIGKFFAVDQLTGAVTIKTDQFSLSGLVGIAFERGGTIKEVSNDPNLISSTGASDSMTVPTQFAVYTYVEERTVPAAGNVGEGLVKFTSNDYDASWQSVVLTNQKYVANGVPGLDATGKMSTANLPNTVSVSNVYVAPGTSVAPSFSFSGRTNIGMYSSGANTLNFSTAGVDRVFIGPSGNVGIGTTTPESALHVVGTITGSGAELVNLNADQMTTGVLAVNRGGTGVTSSTGSGSVVLSASPTLTDSIVLRGSQPTITLQDTDSMSAFLHCNENQLYVLRGGIDAAPFTWTTVNGEWPMILNLSNNDCRVGGNLTAVQNVTAYASDERLKSNIHTIDHALDKVRKLRGVSFDWRDDTPQPMRGHDVGLIAQDVASIMKEAVTLAPFDTDHTTGLSKSGHEYLTIDAGNKLTALLVEAVKELSDRVGRLERR